MPRKDGRPRSLPLNPEWRRPDSDFDVATSRPLGPEPVLDPLPFVETDGA